MHLVTLVASLVVIGACASDPLDPQPQSELPADSTACGEIAREPLRVLASRVLIGSATLNVQTIPAEEASGRWLVAGEIEGDGYEGPGHIAIWASADDPATADASIEFTAVSDLAVNGSQWPPDEVLSTDDPAIPALVACVEDVN